MSCNPAITAAPSLPLIASNTASPRSYRALSSALSRFGTCSLPVIPRCYATVRSGGLGEDEQCAGRGGDQVAGGVRDVAFGKYHPAAALDHPAGAGELTGVGEDRPQVVHLDLDRRVTDAGRQRGVRGTADDGVEQG